MGYIETTNEIFAHGAHICAVAMARIWNAECIELLLKEKGESMRRYSCRVVPSLHDVEHAIQGYP